MPGTPRRSRPYFALPLLLIAIFLFGVSMRVALGPPSASAPGPARGLATIPGAVCFTPPVDFKGESWGISGGGGRKFHGLEWVKWDVTPSLAMHPLWNPGSPPRWLVWATTGQYSLTITRRASPANVEILEAHWEWILGLALVLAAPAAWRLRRYAIVSGRLRRHECLACGYSLAGIDLSAPCPECGAAS